MKVKVRPYPNFKITEESYERDVKGNSAGGTEGNNLSKNLVMVVEFKTGERRVIKSRPVEHKGKKYITAFPNPVHLLLSTAIDNYDNSEYIKDNKFPACGKKSNSNVYILDIEENGTHACFNEYIKYRITSIITLICALEAFLNYSIPNDFIYYTTRKRRPVQLDKTAIESPKVPFKEKLSDVIPQVLDQSDFWQALISEKEIIIELQLLRNRLVHLKTESLSDFERYFEVIDVMLDFDIRAAIDATVTFMNSVKANFIEFDLTFLGHENGKLYFFRRLFVMWTSFQERN